MIDENLLCASLVGETKDGCGVIDRIELEGLAFYGYHGVRPEEKSLGQRFEVDLKLELVCHRSPVSSREWDGTRSVSTTIWQGPVAPKRRLSAVISNAFGA